MCVLVCSEKSAKLLYIFGESHKPNNLFTRHITGLHLKDAKRKVKALLNKIFCSWFLTIPFIFQFYFSSIVFAFSWMLDVIQWNYKYIVLISVYYTCTCMGFFLQGLKTFRIYMYWTDQTDKIYWWISIKRWCLVKYMKPQFALFCLGWSFWKS